MELLKGLEIVEVEYSNDGKKAVFTLFDAERQEIREISFNKQVYNDGEWSDNAEKAAKVVQWCSDLFGLGFDKLTDTVGTKHDVYAYDTFNSFFPVDIVEKFTEQMFGEIYSTEIEKIEVSDLFIKIRYKIEGKTYESKQTLSNYVASMKKYLPNPNRALKEYEKFEKKFGCSVQEADTLVGLPIMVEVRKAPNGSFWGDIKKPRKK